MQMNRYRVMVLACTLALAAGSGCSPETAAPPEAEAEAKPEATAEEQAALAARIDASVGYWIELQQLQYVDDKCHWLDTTSRVALNITVEEQAAFVLDKASSDAPEDQERFNQARAMAETTTCDDEEMKVKFFHATWQQRVTWALRAQALLDGEGRPDWFAAQSPVLAWRAALDETVAGLKAAYGPSIDAFQPKFEAEAVQMLSLTCPNAPQQCPIPEGTDLGETYGKAYAEVWLKSATAFAQALDKDPVKLPPMPGTEDAG